ncbi:hypothetical protein GobsT_14640 [Gemmata obscuriglobus]|nr:hypothetical protein GobsT_14640 [Gemmata obscuriglobus]VTS02444.1 unnamed protein product [Gemmata obscuriglobus UQM 2246]
MPQYASALNAIVSWSLAATFWATSPGPAIGVIETVLVVSEVSVPAVAWSRIAFC